MRGGAAPARKGKAKRKRGAGGSPANLRRPTAIARPDDPTGNSHPGRCQRWTKTEVRFLAGDVTGVQHGKAAPADDYKWGRSSRESDMNNVHPLTAEARKPFIRQIAPQRRVFEVQIKTGAEEETINVMAFTSCDAITMAIDIFFDGEDLMPTDGMTIRANPAQLKAA